MPLTEPGPISARTTRFVEATLAEGAEAVRERLAGRRVEIVLDPSVAEIFAGQAIAFTLLNLLVRLDAYCPALDVALPTVARDPLLRLLEEGPLGRAMERFFAPFPVAGRLTFRDRPHSSPAGDIRLVVGPRPERGVLSVWADGWIAYLNEAAPAGPSDANSVGASVAAGLAAAEIFKRLIADLPLRPGLRVVPVERLVFSAYDYGLAAGANPPLPAAIDVDGVVVVGLGGIGSAFVAAAASLPGLAGSLTLVDKDELDATNLNRHLVARPGDMGPKVALCRRALAFHPDVDARAEWFDEFVAARGDRHELVVVGVDHDRVRRAIQASRPRLILNAGTSESASFQVTRHDYLTGACLACIARDDLRDRPVERELARQLGLELETVLRFQASGEPVPAALLRVAGALSEIEVTRLGDRPLAEIQRRVCAEVPLGTGREEAAVSISFLSALPGFLLLGEVIKERSYTAAERPPLNERVNHALLSVLGRPHPQLLRAWRDRRDDCDCGREAYQRAYRRKWLGGG